MLVGHFAAGVNEAGGTWAEPGGKPFADLARALQPHAAKGRGVKVHPGTPLGICRALGGRWYAYCAGQPDSAWKAADWLGKGAPSREDERRALPVVVRSPYDGPHQPGPPPEEDYDGHAEPPPH